jgi:hypothetical protein
MKKIVHAAGIAAAFALAAGGAWAQAGAAGTTGATVGAGGGATTTANRIAPADGSNALQQPGGMATQGGAPMHQSHLYGAAVVQANQTTRVDGNSTITTTSYWVDVPANVHTDDRFQRWQRLK